MKKIVMVLVFLFACNRGANCTGATAEECKQLCGESGVMIYNERGECICNRSEKKP